MFTQNYVYTKLCLHKIKK